MKITDSIALVTGANRGIGEAFARELLARGARKVYAAAREPATVRLPGVLPLRLDVTNPDDVAAAVAAAPDADLVVNNAGIARFGAWLDAGSETAAREMLEINLFGMLRMSRAFAPVLARNGGGALLNVLSIASWLSGGRLAPYAASKSAAWSLTNALRQELAVQRTQVTALHMGYVDTDLTREISAPKTDATTIVRRALDGLEAGADEVLADALTQQVREQLGAGRAPFLPQAAA